MAYLFALISIFGISWVVADSKISLPIRHRIAMSSLPRTILDFLECAACTGFWLGLVTGLAILHLGWISIPFAFAACAFNLFAFLGLRALEARAK